MASVVKGSNKPSRQAKLRNSCDACSMAKVKCTKEKPVCTRCVKRGQLCMYGTSKRAGRPSQSKIPHSASATAAYMIPKTSLSGSAEPAAERMSSISANTCMFPSMTPDLTSATKIWSDICATLISSPSTSSNSFSSHTATETDFYSSMGSDTPESYFEDMALPTTEMDIAPDYGTYGFDIPFTSSPVPIDGNSGAHLTDPMAHLSHSMMSPDATSFYIQPYSDHPNIGQDGYVSDLLSMVGPMDTISTI